MEELTFFEQFKTKRENQFNEQFIYTFPNGYGASVIKGASSYGLELAVLYKEGITYETTITNDVLGYLNDETLCKALNDIYELKKLTNDCSR